MNPTNLMEFKKDHSRRRRNINKMNEQEETKLSKELLAVQEETSQAFLKELKEYPAVIYYYFPKLVKNTCLFQSMVVDTQST